jgi:hypothetical protein
MALEKLPSKKWHYSGKRTKISDFKYARSGSGLKLPRSEAETGKRMKIGQNLTDKNRRIFGLFGNGI